MTRRKQVNIEEAEITEVFETLSGTHVNGIAGKKSKVKVPESGITNDVDGDPDPDEDPDEDDDKLAKKSKGSFSADGSRYYIEFDLGEPTEPKEDLYGLASKYKVFEDRKIFELGDYSKDKGFSLNIDEAKLAVKNFKPFHLKMTHEKSTCLSGKIGAILDVSIKDNNVLGTIAIPRKFYDDYLTDPEFRKVSAEWVVDPKDIVGLAIVTNPYIKDACFDDSTLEDTSELLIKNDSMINTKKLAYDINPHQALHDIAHFFGARCGDKEKYFPPKETIDELNPAFSEEEFIDSIKEFHNLDRWDGEIIPKDLKKELQKYHDLSVKAGADCDEYQARLMKYRAVSLPAFGKFLESSCFKENNNMDTKQPVEFDNLVSQNKELTDTVAKFEQNIVAKDSEISALTEKLSTLETSFSDEKAKFEAEVKVQVESVRKDFDAYIAKTQAEAAKAAIKAEAALYLNDVQGVKISAAQVKVYSDMIEEDPTSFSIVKKIVDALDENALFKKDITTSDNEAGVAKALKGNDSEFSLDSIVAPGKSGATAEDIDKYRNSKTGLNDVKDYFNNTVAGAKGYK